NDAQLSAMHPGVLVNDVLLDTLDRWVMTHYRTELHAKNLDDPDLINECFTALDALTEILALGSMYPFQQS
ncbi:MAG TPA: succinylarginine dihydrolase, partial [Legionella sp.]|nr:succinylarginine dihydrolase [Legionella sp.]